MQKQKDSPENLKQLLTIGLIVGIDFVYSELKALGVSEQPWDKLLTPIGRVTIGLYIIFAVFALVLLLGSLWMPRPIQAFVEKVFAARWLLSLAMIGFVTWTYLFSPWQSILTVPWTQFVFAIAIARFTTWLFTLKQGHSFDSGELVLAFSIFLYPRIVQETRVIYPTVALVTRGMTLVGFVFLAGLIYIFYQPFGEKLRLKLLDLRPRFGRVRWLVVFILLIPFVYRYIIGAGGYILYPNIRFAVFLAALWTAAYFFCIESDRIVSFESLAESTGWLVLVSAITNSLLLVVSDPFGLYWSEGNRFYDYSLIFGQSLYNHAGTIPNPYDSPGRYMLWGVLYLWTGLPIWTHRLWNVMLYTVLPMILARAFTRNLRTEFLRKILFLWLTAFFILLAVLHPPFIIVMIIIALFAFSPSPYLRGASLVIASLYAGLSRWTWVFAPGAWGALTDLLLYYPKREGNWFKRLLPTVLMTMLGALPGFLIKLPDIFGYTSGDSLTAQQPLLWYRLLPNSTLGPGILLSILLITGPLLALLLYKINSHQWKLDFWQLLGIWGSLIGFLAVGLQISTKIGGGGDLHNLDMYIGTLIVVIMFGLTGQAEDQDVKRWPAWALAMLCFLAFQLVYQFTPFSPSAASHPSLEIPSQAETDSALVQIRSTVEGASKHGEILFMDQRQLLTFGYMPAVPFVPEYEKKYMMDQAMASNESYFIPYYQDLKEHRFALILTEPLKANLKDSGPFSEENDLWVKWVSAPTLCFYEPLMTDKIVGVQLLVPRQNTVDCEKYIK